MKETLTLEFDGGSRGNPGPAGIGVVVRAADRTPLVTLGRFIGRATNNVAEYRALITAMQEAKKLGATKIIIRGDSELIIKQMKGEYRVKHPDMKVLYEEAQSLITQFDDAKIEHNLRHKNELADKLANLAMDRKADVLEADDDSHDDAPPPADPTAKPASAFLKVGEKFTCSNCGCEISIGVLPGDEFTKLNPFVCLCGNRMNRKK
jgi:ribonuclease HI